MGLNVGIGPFDVINAELRNYPYDPAPQNRAGVTSSLGGSIYFGVGAGARIKFDWLEFRELALNGGQ